VADDAFAELKVRDVWGSDRPLVGLAGRFGEIGEDQGSHPGPLVFYVMAVPHRLLGGTAWALQASTLMVQALAVAAALWLARRRSPRFALAVTAALAVLMASLGAGVLTEPWLPYLPILWFFVFLLAVWAVLDHDLLALPVAVLTGSLCVQTHVSYGAVVAAGLVLAGVAASRQLASARSRPDLARRDRGAVGAAAAFGVLAWLPPIADQLGSRRGNLTIVLTHFRHPPEASLGWRDGIDRLLVLLDPWQLVANRAPVTGFPANGSVLPGVGLLAALAGSAVLARSLGRPSLLRLHLLLGVTTVVAGLSLARIIGPAFTYLTLFVWSLTALVLLAVLWTGAVAIGRICPPAAVTRVGTVAALVVLVAAASLLAVDGSRVEPPLPRLSKLVGSMTPGTADGLASGELPGGGRAGRYLVTYSDPVDNGYPTFGLLDELERRGFTVGLGPYYRAAVGEHRVMRPGDATAEIHVAVGPDIDVWRARPGAVEVLYHDPRSLPERAEQRRLEAALALALHHAGVGGPGNPPPTTDSHQVSRLRSSLRSRVIATGLPVAVFVAPPPS